MKNLFIACIVLVLAACHTSENKKANVQSRETLVPTVAIQRESAFPHFVSCSHIPLDSIERVSRFRSGIGHDYSDGYESCCSMKHYFEPKVEDASHIKISSPVDGTVVKLFEEWAGYQVHIRSHQYPAFTFRLFHIHLLHPLRVGDSVSAGEQLGQHIGNMTMSDIACVYHPDTDPNESTLKGHYISYFEVMTDSLLRVFRQKGVSLSNIIISKEERQKSPLQCKGETFSDEGKIPNWVVLK